MADLLTGAIFGMCFFIVPIWAYERGLKAGMRVSKGIEPEPLKSPVQVISDHKQAKVEKKVTDAFIEGFNNIFGFDPLQKEVDK